MRYNTCSDQFSLTQHHAKILDVNLHLHSWDNGEHVFCQPNRGLLGSLDNGWLEISHHGHNDCSLL